MNVTQRHPNAINVMNINNDPQTLSDLKDFQLDKNLAETDPNHAWLGLFNAITNCDLDEVRICLVALENSDNFEDYMNKTIERESTSPYSESADLTAAEWALNRVLDKRLDVAEQRDGTFAKRLEILSTIFAKLDPEPIKKLVVDCDYEEGKTLFEGAIAHPDYDLFSIYMMTLIVDHQLKEDLLKPIATYCSKNKDETSNLKRISYILFHLLEDKTLSEKFFHDHIDVIQFLLKASIAEGLNFERFVKTLIKKDYGGLNCCSVLENIKDENKENYKKQIDQFYILYSHFDNSGFGESLKLMDEFASNETQLIEALLHHVTGEEDIEQFSKLLKSLLGQANLIQQHLPEDLYISQLDEGPYFTHSLVYLMDFFLEKEFAVLCQSIEGQLMKNSGAVLAMLSQSIKEEDTELFTKVLELFVSTPDKILFFLLNSSSLQVLNKVDVENNESKYIILAQMFQHILEGEGNTSEHIVNGCKTMIAEGEDALERMMYFSGKMQEFNTFTFLFAHFIDSEEIKNTALENLIKTINKEPKNYQALRKKIVLYCKEKNLTPPWNEEPSVLRKRKREKKSEFEITFSQIPTEKVRGERQITHVKDIYFPPNEDIVYIPPKKKRLSVKDILPNKNRIKRFSVKDRLRFVPGNDEINNNNNN